MEESKGSGNRVDNIFVSGKLIEKAKGELYKGGFYSQYHTVGKTIQTLDVYKKDSSILIDSDIWKITTIVKSCDLPDTKALSVSKTQNVVTLRLNS